LENVTEISSQRSIFVLFLCGVQLVPRSRGLTKLDLNEVDTMLKHAEIEKNTQAVKNTPHII